MRDPIPAPAALVDLARPFAEKWSLTTLPYHAHEVLLGFVGYHFILHVASPALSRLICPKVYHGFNRRTRLNWDIHWVSMIQALFINTAALYVIFADPQRKEMDWKGRLWGYTPASGMVQGFAAGYFLWDLQVSTQYIALSGPSALLHAIGALAVTCIGFVSCSNTEPVRPSTDWLPETLCKLLRPFLRPLRALDSLPEHPLVLRQAEYDRLKAPAVQRHRLARLVLFLSSRLGNLPVCTDLFRHLHGPYKPCDAYGILV